MADTTATLKIRAIDDGAIATVNNVSNAFTGLTIGTTALSLGFQGLQKASSSSAGQFLLGSQNAEKLAGSIGKLANANSKALQTFSALSDITFLSGQALTFAKGVQDAAAVYARIPQTFDLFRSSGVSTQSIEDFYTLTDAVKGSEASLESFAISAVQNLGRFEQAAARAGTILKSSVRFNEAGVAEGANAEEKLQNAFQVQDIVNKQLNNTVKSTDALLGQYEVLSSGFTKAADSQQVLAAGLKLTGIGQAGGVATDPGETLRLLGKTLNAYQLSASEAAKTAAVLNAVVENGITTVPELSQGFGQTATTARAAGIALNDLAAGTAVLTTQGINTATALTGLQRVAGSIIQKTPEAQKALDKLSLNGQKIRFDQAEVQAKGFTQALIDLNTAAGGNVKVLQEIFPEEIAFRTVLALLTQDGKKLESVLNSVAGASANSLDEVFKGASADRISRFEQIANKFQELIIKVAASVAPVFEPGIEVLGRIAQIFSDLPEPVKQAVGQFIALQISSRATAGAVGVLFQAMLNLGSTYLQVRLLSLALSGQLGKELGIIRELIVQKKGLASAVLQLIGFDQRYRLGVEATTAAVEKQGIVSKAVAAVKTKAGEILNRTVETATGLNIDQLKEQGKKAAAEVGQVAKNVAVGVGEAAGVVATPVLLGANGQPLNATGLNRVKQEAQKVGGAIASGLKDSVENIGDVIPKVELLGSDGKLLSSENIKEQAEKATNAVKEGLQKGQSALQDIAPKGNFELITADDTSFIQGDKELQAAKKRAEELRQAEINAKKDILKATEEFNLAKAESNKKSLESDKATIEARKVLNDSESTAEQRQQALTEAIKKRSEAEEAANKVGEARDNIIQKREDFERVRRERIDQEINLLGLQEQATTKYAVAAEKQALARRFNAQSIGLQEKATIAKNKADELELLLQITPDNIQAQAEAKRQRALATSLEEKATQFKARAELEAAAATQLGNLANRSAMLAEMGLAETRIFGRNVLFSTQGPIGAINTLLATEVNLKTANIAVTKALAVAQAGLTGGANVFGNIIKGGFTGGLSLLKSGFSAVSGAVTGLLGTLGPLGVLLTGVGLTVAVFKEDLFGLRKTANEAAEGLREIIKADNDLAKKFGTEERLLKFKAEIQPGDASTVETRLEELRLSGALTTSQFSKLREALTGVASDGKLAADGVEKFRNQLESIRQGATGTPEKGVGDRIGEFFGAIGRGIINAPGFAAETIISPFVDPLNTFNLGAGGARSKIRANREADQTVQSRSELRILSSRFGDFNFATTEQIEQFRKAQGLTTETNQKIASGEKLASEDLERENQRFQAQKSRNEQLISQFDQQIKKQRETIDQVTDPELKASYQGQLDAVIAQRNALEKRNELLKQGNEEFTKYYTEILPGLKRAITETTNLQQALSNAQNTFNQQFKLDADGKTTPFFKDISTLRTEAQQLQSSILEAYQGGQFEKGGVGAGEVDVANRLRNIRDNRINLADSTTGFRLGVNDRIAATQQIVEFEQSASKQRGEILKLDAEKIKLQQQQRVISSEQAERQITKIQLETIQESLRQKEIEIKEYAQFPVRKAQLEREAAAIRVQIEQAVANESNQILERQRQRRQEIFKIEAEEIKTLRAERLIGEQNAQTQSAQVELKASRDRLQNLIDDYNKIDGFDADFANRIKVARLQIRQQEAALEQQELDIISDRTRKFFTNIVQSQVLAGQADLQEFDFQSKALERNQQLFNSASQIRNAILQSGESQLQLQLKLTGDVEKQAQIEAQIAEGRFKNLAITQQQERESLIIQEQLTKLGFEREATQIRIQKIQADDRIAELNFELDKAKRDKKTIDDIEAIELQIKSAQQQRDLLDKQGEQLDKNIIQQAKLTEGSRRELEIKQGVARQESALEVILARRRELQGKIEKQVENIRFGSQQINIAGQIQIQQSEAISKAYDQQKNVLQSVQNIQKGKIDIVTGELQLASQLSNSDNEKRKIATSIAAIKLRSLEQQLQFEERVLNINLAQQSSQLEQEKIRNRVAVANSKAGIAQAQADLAKTQLDPKATPQQIQAAQLNLQAKVEEAIATQYAGTLLNQQGANQEILANLQKQQFQQNATLQRNQARVEFANSTGDRSLINRVREQVLGSALGGVTGDEVGASLDAFVRQQTFGNRGLTPLEEQRAARVFSNLGVETPPSLQLLFPDFEKFRRDQLSRFQEFGYQMPSKTSPQDLNKAGEQTIIDAVKKLNDLVEQKLGNPNQVGVTANITNNFNSADKAAGTTVVNQIRDELKEILLKVQK